MRPNRSHQEWQELDKQHQVHPFTDIHAYSQSGGRIFNRAEHIYIFDTEDNRILDGMSGLWCCGLGYSQQSIIDAVTEQLNQLPYYNSFFNCTNDIAVEMTKKLLDVAPDNMRQVFFTNSGSEANDSNIRFVHRYFDLLEQPNKKHIISRSNAYHGSTIAAASLGGMKPMHDQFGTLPYVHHIPQPHWYESGTDLDQDAFGLQVAEELNKKIDELGQDNVAAFIAEPVQGAGGVIIPPSTYWPRIQQICNERDVLLISDEVICGFGRTGQWFGCQTYGFEPDLITFAKTVTNGYQPLGGVLIGGKIAQVLGASGGEFTHGFTYSGHPGACAAGVATLDVLHKTNMINHIATDIGPYFEKQWQQLSDHPIVGEARSRGYFGAIELVRDKHSRERLADDSAGALFCRNTAINSGLMVRAVGDAMICSPPFVCSHEEIDQLMTLLVEALDQTAKEFGISK